MDTSLADFNMRSVGVSVILFLHIMRGTSLQGVGLMSLSINSFMTVLLFLYNRDLRYEIVKPS